MKKKQKQAIEKAGAKQKALKKELAAVRGELTRTEKKLTKAKERQERWKQEAQAHAKSSTRAAKRAEKLQRALDAAAPVLESVPAAELVETVATSEPDTTPASTSEASTATTEGAGTPDATWTLVQLRAEARSRGLTGMSNKPKAQLISALS